MTGAAPLSAELTKDFIRLLPGCAIGQGYGESHHEMSTLVTNNPWSGMTESATTISAMPASQKLGPLGSAGQLLPGIRARVVKRDGSLARPGEQGELFINAPTTALGYLNDDKAYVGAVR